MSRDRDTKGWYFHQITKRNGNLLKETMMGTNLEAIHHRFCKWAGKLWTFLADTTRIKSQIDYFLVRKKWRNSDKNTEAYNSYTSIGSDHRLVAATVKLSLRSNKSQSRRNMTGIRLDGTE